MTSQREERKDHWSSKAYTASAPFVPLLTSTVLSYLSPSPTDHILDIGCGDGQLTAQIAASVPYGRVLGLDASASMISTAQEKHTAPNCTFRLQDCTRLSDATAAAAAAADDDDDGLLTPASWDKVFSNAALHWILRAPATRMNVLRGCHALLKPGGAFVFELGGAGNVAEVHAALVAALVAHGAASSPAEARAASPWFFPSEAWMRGALREVGFEVERVETEYRPTRLTEEGGLEGWVRLMGAAFLERVEAGRREEVVRWVGEVLRDVVTREEDGSRWIGYVRLRGVARKV